MEISECIPLKGITEVLTQNTLIKSLRAKIKWNEQSRSFGTILFIAVDYPSGGISLDFK